MSTTDGLSSTTIAVHAGDGIAERMVTRAKTMPIFESSVFVYDDLDSVDDFLSGNPDNYMYTRLGNPNQRALEELAVGLEGGSDAFCATSGMAALHAAITSLCSSGDRIVASRDLYGGSVSLLKKELERFGLVVVFCDMTDPENASRHIVPGTKLVLAEITSNPLLRVCPVDLIAEAAHKAGALFLLDNTFMSPMLFKGLEWGADAVLHSTTKYINGHSDAMAGILTASKEWVASARRVIANAGGSLSPFDAWLTLRGAKTLGLRMKAHSENGLRVASFLEAHPQVTRVYYPGLESHDQHALAKRLFTKGFGGMLSFDIRGGLEGAKKFVKALRNIAFAPSLAGVSTTISHPAKTSHRGHSPSELAELGIGQETIRLSVGIEEVSDIESDLDQALRAI